MLGNIVVGLILAVAVGLAIRSIYKKRKSGGCSCGCSGCPSNGSCCCSQEE